jgi:hypothetical protein
MRLLAALVGVSVALMLAQPVEAAKSVAPSSITVDQTDVAYGDTVTFTTTVGIRLDRNTFVYIGVNCTQGSAQVFGELVNVDDSLTLIDGPYAAWDGGAATCVAYLTARTATSNRVSYQTLATTTFAASKQGRVLGYVPLV